MKKIILSAFLIASSTCAMAIDYVNLNDPSTTTVSSSYVAVAKMPKFTSGTLTISSDGKEVLTVSETGDFTWSVDAKRQIESGEWNGQNGLRELARVLWNAQHHIDKCAEGK